MVVQFSRWGHSIALRIPRQLMKEIGATEGMSAEIRVENGRLVIAPVDEWPRYELSDLLAGITEENLHGEIDTGRAVGVEFV